MIGAACSCRADVSFARPLWSVSPDDFFCPWCGGQLRRLFSDSLAKDEHGEPALTLYLPRRTGEHGPIVEFRAAVGLEYHDRLHERQEERYLIDLDRGAASVEMKRHEDFDVSAEFHAGTRNDDLAAIVIRLKANLRTRTGQPGEVIRLPRWGAKGTLKVLGAFPETRWSVLLCESPELRCTLKGQGIRPVASSRLDNAEPPQGFDPFGVLDYDEKTSYSYWEIVDLAALRLKLIHQAIHAPVWTVDDRSSATFDRVTPVVVYEARVYSAEGQMRLRDEFHENEARPDRNSLFHIIEPFREGHWLAPDSRDEAGDAIVHESILRLDATLLAIGEIVDLKVMVRRRGEPDDTLTHIMRCRCVDVGRIEVSPSEITLPEMYVGEWRSNARNRQLTNPEGCATLEEQRRYRLTPVIPPVEVLNGGQAEIRMFHRVEGDVGWLRVGWEAGSTDRDSGENPTAEDNVATLNVDDPSELVLPAGTTANLLVELDFRGRSFQESSQYARVILEQRDSDNDGQTVELRDLIIQIQRVADRVPAESPLFVDFGNSNSFATVRASATGNRLEIRSAHSHLPDERFTSALLLERLMRPADQSACLIGPFAVRQDRESRGPDNVPRLISGLKQSLCRLPGEKFVDQIACMDLSQSRQWLTPTQLLTLFLRELVHRAELLWRGRRIDRLVISYPSRLAPAQRRAYFRAFEQACEVISADKDRAGHPLHLESGIRIDEANAVAIGFAQTLDPELRSRITQCLARNDNTMRVAAIDLGGGSLDVAVMTFRNRAIVPGRRQWTSSYEWIGGDARFGGNNLTVAATEWLRSRLAEWTLPDSIAARHESLRDLFQTVHFARQMTEVPTAYDFFHGLAENRAPRFHAFWEAAELIKLWAMDRAEQGGRKACDPETESVATARTPEPLPMGSVALDDRPSGAAMSPTPRGERRDRELAGLIGEMLRLPAEAARQLMAAPGALFDRLWPSLDEITDHQLTRDQHGAGGYSASGRLKENLDHLWAQIDRKGISLDFAVIGGGASRWRLLQDELRRRLGAERVVYQPERLKSQVAEGLALAWHSISRAGSDSLACSGDYITATLALLDPVSETPHPILDVCSRLNPETPAPGGGYRLRLLEHPEIDSPTVLREFICPVSRSTGRDSDGAGWELRIGRVFDEHNWEPMGRFEAVGEGVPPPETWRDVELRFGEDEDELDLIVYYETGLGATSSRQNWSTQLKPLVGHQEGNS